MPLQLIMILHTHAHELIAYVAATAQVPNRDIAL